MERPPMSGCNLTTSCLFQTANQRGRLHALPKRPYRSAPESSSGGVSFEDIRQAETKIYMRYSGVDPSRYLESGSRPPLRWQGEELPFRPFSVDGSDNNHSRSVEDFWRMAVLY